MHHPFRVVRAARTLTLVVGLLAIAPIPASAGGADAKWAWATVRTGTTGSLVSGPRDAGSWNNGGAGVTRTGTGRYLVTLYGALSAGATTQVALVSPIGTTARTCTTGEWYASSSSVVVEVLCQTLDGVAMDSRFAVHWLAAAGVGGRLGYGYNFSPTSNCGGPSQDYNSNGDPVRTCPVSGTAEMRFENQDVEGGVAIVSASDEDNAVPGSFPTSCAVAKWGTLLNQHDQGDPNDDTIDRYVRVRCWETDDSDNIYHRHVTVFLKGLGLKGIVREHVAYLLARRESATTAYRPDRLDRYSSSGGTITIRAWGSVATR